MHQSVTDKQPVALTTAILGIWKEIKSCEKCLFDGWLFMTFIVKLQLD